MTSDSESLDDRIPLARFEHRGLSDRTIGALVRAGLDAPERLLSMSMVSIGRLKGIGDVSLSEIAEYRRQYSTDAPSPSANAAEDLNASNDE
jgi:hypothetical protein